MLLNATVNIYFLMGTISPRKSNIKSSITDVVLDDTPTHKILLQNAVEELAKSVYQSTFGYFGIDFKCRDPYVEMKTAFAREYGLPPLISENGQIALERLLDPIIDFAKEEKQLIQDSEEQDWLWSLSAKKMTPGDLLALKGKFLAKFDEYRKTKSNRASYFSRVAMLELETDFGGLTKQFSDRLNQADIKQTLQYICKKEFK